MISIRKGTWETNSSSCHSVTYTEDITDGVFNVNTDHITLRCDGDYGWSYSDDDKVNTPEEKLDYYAVSESYRYRTRESYEQFLSELKDFFESKGVTIELDVQWEDRWDNRPIAGYIDHESAHILFEEKDFDSVFEWVFTDGTGVMVLNDNGYYDDDMDMDLHFKG